MRLLAVTTCTDRKRFSVPRALDAARLPVGTQDRLTEIWRQRVRDALAVGKADTVYCGRSFQEALQAAKVAGTELFVISGGLGLLPATRRIPSYGLSLVPQSEEYIGSRVRGSQFKPDDWWRHIQSDKRKRSPLADLVRNNRDAVTAIAVSSTYLPLISQDLLSLEDPDLERIRLTGLGIAAACPDRLRPYVLPYDDRLDGPDSELPGTRGDFGARALRHFAEVIFPKRPAASADKHSKAIVAYLDGWRRAPKFSRTPKTDAQIIELIRKAWRKTGGQSARTLRYLRDVKKVACEQGRFRTLFLRVVEEVSP